jgi:hypothetical protein
MDAVLFTVAVLAASLLAASVLLWRTRTVLGEYIGRHRR